MEMARGCRADGWRYGNTEGEIKGDLMNGGDGDNSEGEHSSSPPSLHADFGPASLAIKGLKAGCAC